MNRIKKKKDFDLIFKKGASFKNSFLILRVIKNNLDQTRFGFVVSQKVSKKAVVRNKIRRRLSEVIKNGFKNTKTGIDIIFISLPGIDKKEFSEIKEAVRDLLAKAKCLTP